MIVVWSFCCIQQKHLIVVEVDSSDAKGKVYILDKECRMLGEEVVW